MNRRTLRKYKLPDSSGVYLFKKGKEILYIGRASSLKSRISSYFGKDLAKRRGFRLVEMVVKASKLSFNITDTTLEAIILEAALIKKHQPYYNAREKDDKSFLYITITKEDFPRVLLARNVGDYGPFTDAHAIRVGLKIVRKIFPFRDNCSPEGKACFYSQIGLCPGVCSGLMSKKDYAQNIKNIRELFSGRKTSLIIRLKKMMGRFVSMHKFEQAARFRNNIFALKHINDIALMNEEPMASTVRIEAYDISHLGGLATVGCMAVVENGKLE